MLGDAAGQAAVELCAGTALASITTDNYGPAKPFTTAGMTFNSILLTPDAITQANLQDVLTANWIDKATLCKDVKAGTVAVCG